MTSGFRAHSFVHLLLLWLGRFSPGNRAIRAYDRVHGGIPLDLECVHIDKMKWFFGAFRPFESAPSIRAYLLCCAVPWCKSNALVARIFLIFIRDIAPEICASDV